jgi:hypothetical protein
MWPKIAAKTNEVLESLRINFELACAGGEKLPRGVNKINRSLFRYIWEFKLANHEGSFKSLEDLDHFYEAARQNLETYIHEFSAKDDLVTAVVREDNVKVWDLSDNQRNFFASVIGLYHALVRNQFICQKLGEVLKEDEFENQIRVVCQKAEIVNGFLDELDSKISIDRYQNVAVNSFKLLLLNLANTLNTAGYELDVTEIRNKDLTASSNSQVFDSFYQYLNAVPSITALTQSLSHNKKLLRAQLAAIDNGVAAIKHIREKVLPASRARLDKIRNRYESLKHIKSDEKYHTFFSLLDMLGKSNAPVTDGAPADGLRLCAKEAINACYQLSFRDAGENAASQIKGLLQDSRDAVNHYQVWRGAAESAVNTCGGKRRELSNLKTEKLIDEWDFVNNAFENLAKQAEAKMEAVRKKVHKMSEPTLKYILRGVANFFRRIFGFKPLKFADNRIVADVQLDTDKITEDMFGRQEDVLGAVEVDINHKEIQPDPASARFADDVFSDLYYPTPILAKAVAVPIAVVKAPIVVTAGTLNYVGEVTGLKKAAVTAVNSLFKGGGQGKVAGGDRHEVVKQPKSP